MEWLEVGGNVSYNNTFFLVTLKKKEKKKQSKWKGLKAYIITLFYVSMFILLEVWVGGGGW